MVEPGRRCLGDRYELHQLIASGGMGQVWQGHDIALHRPVAVKVLRSEYTGDPTFLARFRAEAQHAASLSHPNIAAVFDYGEEIAQDGTGETLAYLVMELVDGEPLSALLAREGALSTETTLSLLRQTAFALGEAHRAGMVHRDVKPGNVLVRPDGSVKITDFGIAHSARSVALTRTGQVIGTPQYLSPEQAEGRPATPASDVYALGLIGYECLVGRPAFEGDNPVTIALMQVRQEPEPLPGELPEDVRELICRALVKDADERYADGDAFVAAIDAIRAGRPLPAATTRAVPAAVVPPPRTDAADTRAVSRPPRDPRRGRIAMVLLPLLGLLAGAGIAVALVQALTDSSPGAPANAAEQRDAGSIVLDAADFVGDPVGEVAERLTALGLDVELRSERRADAVPDRVTAVEPDGEPLSPGDTVVVTYAIGPSGVEGGGEGSSGGAGVTGAAVGGSATTGGGPTEDSAGGPTEGAADDGAAQPTDGAAEETLPATPTDSETQAPETSTPSEPATESPTTTTPAPSTSAGTSSAPATSDTATG
ncbi:protein kinase domain-containing protein [Blastococcus sp. PRF04-17]|uniref:protein kinase domain-containing protein n=1 Tax=Blastococcus sp. PRF04-17 TaxID=2933797 RepID=UPI001FF69029|nr:protein kinase [Blastococcus sp. PRF04-17]UOY00499.1 protein kinase [Blastococcus sp. PRF04-17]